MANFFKPTKKTSTSNKHFAVDIERYDYQGAGIGFNNKKLVFVEGALVGEKVLVQPTETKSKFIRAKLIKVQQKSDARREPFCPHFDKCGGCSLQHMPYQTQLEVKQQAFKKLMSKLAPSIELSAIIQGDERGYRRRSRISLRWNPKSQQLEFGFRQGKSNQIVSIDQCPVMSPSLQGLLEPARAVLSSLSQPRNLGHLELVDADNTQVVLLRTTEELKTADKEAMLEFAKAHQVSLYLHQGKTEPELVYGDAPVSSETGSELLFLPTDFIQVNRSVNQQMVSEAISWLDLQASERVLDLFSGIGNFTFPISKLSSKVIGIEGVQEMVDRASHNATKLGVENAEFYQANLADLNGNEEWSTQGFDKILLDPARAGAQGIVEQLGQFNASKIVYVSCNPSTLARDSESLLEQGYKISKMRVLDMFPQTGHLESMVLFEK
ncbi:23S rRNA (uracil-5-) -methyltransferase RumA [Vibrio ishigakensis]|uniref:23S rRNA (uracil(1939)-C(5))-methyltransferase RlmD n=1 Tax=Vibrio ishigakensis TaxID=1481914 RepID=A0A0B8PH97_9VIBR|nr:23S rRNA (uracil-5-) -methyltransferase RumA [Vibrio ishigakensis]